MQQGGGGGGGGGGGHQSQDEEMGAPTTGAVSSSHMVSEQSEQLVEAASPISSRPPATGNLDEFIRFASGGGDEGGDEGDRAGGGGGAAGVSSGNRWPRQETLALLKIRSDMDAVFRDATVKGPLWEDVSRKLAELGYKRSAKKCKEKFENVHKYYKRTKEGRAGRQDGKSYKFFSQLEALHTTSPTVAANVSTPMIIVTATTAASLDVAPVSVGIPMPISSVRIPPTAAIRMSSSVLPMPPAQVPPPITTTAAPFGISFSSNSSSSSEGFEDDDDGEDEVGGEPSSMAGTSRKRKRQSSRGGGSTTRRMMEFFEVLMKQVMQKQEAMQQRFLEAIERREQDRMIREEAWKRQEMARLTHEHELMAQERAIAASRDAAIISFLEKITGQTIWLPTTVTIPAAPPPLTQPAVPVVPPIAPIPAATPPSHQPPSLPQQQQRNSQPQQLQQSQSHYQHRQQQQQQQPQNTEVLRHHQQPISSEVLIAIPEQQVPPQEIGGSASLEPASSRWPKAEVLALINLRSGLETTYQEAGPKGPFWEEISTGMFRMGYRRSAKRCKEKWENINKYFKKVKESNKKRPEDAKTCPYFHQLDFLYREKILGGGTSGGSSSFGDRNRPEEETSQQHQETSDAPPIMAAPQLTQPTDQSEDKTGADVVTSKEHLPGSLFGEGNGGAAKKKTL
ncbi:trihelix transcription factor GTL1-like isoform X2 [Durio zibethinus]|uniref:Trihelix transcription factor GTL1-like isoform X2 n=1 Tax=Durio zibethinus TaxID=66656 RepID=A0A6P5Y7G7_DURZI|nr:trihelix transcription factor GTL1-like isoform X2 [Durio zibethinus]